MQFVVIGGAGIQSHGRRYDTLDIDVTPDRDEANLHRLAALNELDCRRVTDPANTAAWVPLPPDYFTPRSLLTATVWNLAHSLLGQQGGGEVTADELAARVLAEHIPGRRKLGFVAIGASTSGRTAAEAEELLAGGFGR